MDAGNFRGSRRVAKNKMFKMCIFAKDGDFKNSNFQNAILRSNDIPGGGVLGSIFAGYVPLASQNPYPIIVYSVANY